jgi:NAD(P)-dependent dehydrogenase (short-subunit alcohol dehydrogenase family)
MKSLKLKPLNQQVVVIVGASSGIGRETARRFAARGARVVVAARSAAGLESLVREIGEAGGEAMARTCEVADPADVRALADAAVARFGRIDTWVNNAAVATYARFEETSLEEFRRIMDVNFMGQVHGFQAALPHLRREGRGALIATSSIEALVSMPLHSAYAASKHAVEGMVDALRRELMAEGVPISVTSIKPATINTPFFNNAANHMDVKPTGMPPIYDPGMVADCILHAATHRVRDIFAGGSSKLMATTQALAPNALDRTLAKTGIEGARTDEPVPGGSAGALFAPREHESRVRGDFTDKQTRSPYTWLETHPTATRLALGLLAGGAVFALRRRGAATRANGARPRGGEVMRTPPAGDLRASRDATAQRGIMAPAPAVARDAMAAPDATVVVETVDVLLVPVEQR